MSFPVIMARYYVLHPGAAYRELSELKGPPQNAARDYQPFPLPKKI